MKDQECQPIIVSRNRTPTLASSIAVVGTTCPLGRHLVDALLASGRSVLGLCRSLRKVPLHWRKHPAFHCAEFDLRSPSAVGRLLQKSDQIVWLAQSADMEGSDVAALAAVCSSSLIARQKIILLSSGGSVYGNPNSLPVSEDHPSRPLSVYGESKKRLEETLRACVERREGLCGVVLRCGNIYGRNYLLPGAKGCIGAFTQALVTGSRVPIIARGLAVRDFVHVEDVLRAILSALDWEQPFSVWNVGSGVGTQIVQVLDTLCEILNCAPAGFIHRDATSSDVGMIFLNIDRIAKDCSWQPRISLRQGLESILLSVKDSHSEPAASTSMDPSLTATNLPTSKTHPRIM